MFAKDQRKRADVISPSLFGFNSPFLNGGLPQHRAGRTAIEMSPVR